MTARATDLPTTAERRTWPLTLGLDAVAVLLVVVDLFGAVIATAPFFGDIPSRAQYLEAGATVLSAVLPLAVLVVAGWCLGSRFGLIVIVVAAGVSVAVGTTLLTHPGDPSDPGPGRPLAASDFVSNLNVLNGIALAVALLVLVLVVVVRRRRQAGARGPGSSSTPA